MKIRIDETKVSREVVIITKYFLPSVNVDSDAVYHMINGLKRIDQNLKIYVVTTEIKYKGDIPDNGKYSDYLLNDIIVHRIKGTWPDSNYSWIKLIANLIDGFKLVNKARNLKVINIISLSNPPLISLWHSLLLKRSNFFYWTFDIFPQALVADRILEASNFFYKLVKKLTYLNSPTSLIALGDHQYSFLLKAYNKPINKIILPCGIHNESLNSSDALPIWKDNNMITIGYLGNLGRAHSLEFVKNVIIAVRNRPQVKLILSVYGFHKAAIDEISAVKSDNIQIIDFVEKRHLKFIDVHLVSLKDSWNNISVPSKAVSAVCSGGALWYCGQTQVDTWTMFEQCSFRSSEGLDSINSVLDALNSEDLILKKNKAALIGRELLAKESNAYDTIYNLLR